MQSVTNDSWPHLTKGEFSWIAAQKINKILIFSLKNSRYRFIHGNAPHKEAYMLRKPHQKFVSTFTAVLVLSAGYIELSSNATDYIERSGSKTYVNLRQVGLNRSGFRVAVDGKTKNAPALYHDKRGYFIKEKSTQKCPNNHNSVTYSDECAHTECPYYYCKGDIL